MPIQSKPDTLYPNSVASHLVDYLRGRMDAKVEHYGSDLFFEEDGIHVHPDVMNATGVFVNARAPITQDARRGNVVNQRWRGRVRVTHHNPTNEVEQHHEGLVYTQRAIALLQGYRVPHENVKGVDGGPRLIDTDDAEQLINTPNFAAYEFDFSLEVAHDLEGDLSS